MSSSLTSFTRIPKLPHGPEVVGRERGKIAALLREEEEVVVVVSLTL